MKYWYIVLPLTILSIIIATYLNHSKDVAQNYKQYTIVKKQTIINGIIAKVTTLTSNSIIDMKDCDKLWINTTNNYDYKQHELNKFLQERDSLSKKENNDTLFIFRGKFKYYFVINKAINFR